MRRVLPAMLILGLALGAWAASQPVEGAPTVDEETARRFNDFRRSLSKRLERTVDEIAKRYDLREEQKERVRQLTNEFAGAFFKQHAQDTFDLFQRMRALRGFMREERLGWREVPQDIKQDLAERALPMIDAVQKQMAGFAEALDKSLDPEQRGRLRRDRQRMEIGFRMARVQVQIMSGKGVVGEGPLPGPGRRGAPRPGRQPQNSPAGFAGPRLDRWERYVVWFVQRYRLDEIQKLQAKDLLKKYKAKAARAAHEPAKLPATQPASKRSVQDFQKRLARLRRQRRPIRRLFEQLKAELEKIPTPVQRKLAEDAAAKARLREAPAGQDARPPRKRNL